MLRFRLLARGVVAASLCLGVLSTPAHAADPVVAAAGDIACDPTSLSFNNGNGTSTKCRQKYTSDLLVGQDLAAVLPLGDTQYEFGTLEQFQLSYDLSWGRLKSITRPAVGNHEYDLLAGDGYFDYFNGVGNDTGPAGDRDKGYYSFDVGDWHLIALNSMCVKIDGCEAGSPQERWLRADLAANAGTSCTLAYWHHPLFSSGIEGTDEDSDTTDLWQALYEGGAEVVLNGHEHLYERFAPQTALGVADPEHGLREFIVGTGGKSFHDLGSIELNSVVRDNTHFGVIKLVLHDGSYDWSFVTETGAVRDPGSGTCHDAPDLTPPQTSLSSGPANLTRERDISFSFSSSEDGSSFECELDGPGATQGNASSCTSPRSYTGLADGAYTFKVKARDPAGNEDQSPATQSFTVDATAPNTSIDDGPSGTITTRGATFKFHASEAGSTFECELDGPGATQGNASACSSPRAYSGLADGTYTYTVRARDLAGNEEQSAATRSFTVDATAPNTSITDGPSGTSSATSAEFTFDASEAGSTFKCQLDGPGATSGSASACSSPQAYDDLADGTYTFKVKARDAAGNEDQSPATRSFTVDTTAPHTSLSSGPQGLTKERDASFSFTSSEAGSTFECKLDGPGATEESASPCSSSKPYSGLADGAYTFTVKARDAVGNEEQSPATRSFTVDGTAPDTSISDGPSGVISIDSATFTFDASETGSTFSCRLDGGAWADCTSLMVYADLTEGSHTFETHATDAAGNTDLSPAAWPFTVELPVEPDPVDPDPVDPTPDPVDPAPGPVDPVPGPDERPTTLPDPVGDLASLKHYRVVERDIVSGRAYRRRGGRSRLYADDGDRLEIAAEQKRSGVFVSEFQAFMELGTEVRDSLGSLTLSYDGGTSARTGTVTVSVFNYRAGRWVKALARTGRRDRSLEWSASAFASDYISQDGTFSIRVKGKRAKAVRTRTDLLELTVES